MDFSSIYPWFVIFIWGTYLIILALRIFLTGREYIGKPSIQSFSFYSAKLSIFLCGIAAILQAIGINLRWFTFVGSDIISLVLIAIGALLIIISRTNLGKATLMGLPIQNTALKTNGLYSFSRNPMYVAVYFLIFGAILYTVNPIVLLLGILLVILHHKIILAEEVFLELRFGEEYRIYKRIVRRYF